LSYQQLGSSVKRILKLALQGESRPAKGAWTQAIDRVPKYLLRKVFLVVSAKQIAEKT
jgi:hypothetical protein